MCYYTIIKVIFHLIWFWFKVTCAAAHSSVTNRPALLWPTFWRLGQERGLVYQETLSNVNRPCIRLSTMDQTDHIQDMYLMVPPATLTRYIQSQKLSTLGPYGSEKKQDTWLFIITMANIDRFSDFLLTGSQRIESQTVYEIRSTFLGGTRKHVFCFTA